ncbi:MAG: hypothetical protein K0M40_03870 [Prolixibacteraceae bacterium]|nr:hypothetical protein [Prolixibacteraceae bacterium]
MKDTTDFNNSSLSERYSYISDHGKYIGVRYYFNYAINLYLVEDEFFELWYFSPSNEIEKIEPLDDFKKIKHMNELENIQSHSLRWTTI